MDTFIKYLKIVLCSIVFIGGLALVILGQQKIGPQGLLAMLIGLIMLVALLWYYNRQNK